MAKILNKSGRFIQKFVCSECGKELDNDSVENCKYCGTSFLTKKQQEERHTTEKEMKVKENKKPEPISDKSFYGKLSISLIIGFVLFGIMEQIYIGATDNILALAISSFLAGSFGGLLAVSLFCFIMINNKKIIVSKTQKKYTGVVLFLLLIPTLIVVIGTLYIVLS